MSYTASLLLRLFVFSALPVMLAIWFRSGAVFTLSNGLRWCARGTAAILGIFFLLDLWVALWRIFGSPAATRAPLQLSPWYILRFVSDAVLVILLITLSRRPGAPTAVRMDGFRLLRSSALIAAGAAMIAVLLNTSQIISSARLQMAQRDGFLMRQGGHMELVSPPTTAQIGRAFVVESLVPLCRLMISLIVYGGLSTASRREDAGA